MRADRIPPALLVGHLPDHERAALQLGADLIQLLLALLLGSLTRRLHVHLLAFAGEMGLIGGRFAASAL